MALASKKWTWGIVRTAARPKTAEEADSKRAFSAIPVDRASCQGDPQERYDLLLLVRLQICAQPAAQDEPFLSRSVENRTKPFAPMNSLYRHVLSIVAALALHTTVFAQAQMDLPRIKLTAGMHLIDAQLARTPEQREIGLMFREKMPTHEGMLFEFETPGVQCFWMKNTLLPLTAAFVADDGRIVNLVNMKPQTTDSHCSKEPVRYVLEMNHGWFAKRGIAAGAFLRGAGFSKNK